MEYSYEVKEDCLILKFIGDLIGENHGPELISIVNDQLNKNVIFCIVVFIKSRNSENAVFLF